MLAVLAMAAAGFSSVAVWKAETHAQASADGSHGMLAPPAPDKRLDINHATMAELMTIPGMSPSWASRIVRFRPYHAKSDLLQRGVLPGDVYDRIKDYVIAHRVKKD